ncbi:MAG: hypothetical protein ACE147_13095 [Candidatus Methylomirabilales bacterium]
MYRRKPIREVLVNTVLTVVGATGQTGKIAGAPLKAGEPVRALGRSPAKLAELKARVPRCTGGMWPTRPS